jgi:alpha-L-fucosidase 2
VNIELGSTARQPPGGYVNAMPRRPVATDTPWEPVAVFDPASLRLAYVDEAAAWVEALPVGNGRLGAMVYGGHASERIGLNEDTFWSGPGDLEQPRVPADLLDRVRRLVSEGRSVAAGEALRGTQGADAEAYQPVGDLHIAFAGGVERGRMARRWLDLRDGVAGVRRLAAGGEIRQEVLASVAYQVVAVRLATDTAAGLDLELSWSTPQPRAQVCAHGDDGLALLLAAPRHVVPSPRPDGVLPDDDARQSTRAAGLMRVSVEGDEGSVTVEARRDGPSVIVRAASAVTVFVAIRTGFDDWNTAPTRTERECLALCEADVRAARTARWAAVRAAHVQEHRAVMDRVRFTLDTPPPADEVPTDVRLARRAAGEPDEQLAVLAFAFGRYLLAGSSRPGTQPANLQGIWNSQVSPPWNSQYTVNINTEMNYWPAETTGLADCHEPLLRMVGELARAGRETARAIYGARGWTCHHNTDLWRITVPVGGGHGDPMWAQWPLGGAWLSLHLAEHWRFGRDPGFLAAALPIAVDAARFVLDLLVTGPDGWLVTSPSTSPENQFRTDEGPASVVAGSAMDLALARELFDFILEAEGELHRVTAAITAADRASIEEIRRALPRLAPLRIGADGQVLEWSAELPEADPHHRHLSHLVGLYPGRSIATDPRLRTAARRSLQRRGDAGTGWSIAWKVGLWARLGDGAAAHRLLGTYLTPVTFTEGNFTGGGVYRSMLCAHPPFQIDGNLGVTAAIAEMLVQSHLVDDGVPVIDLLPALPPQWPSGRISGLRARGGVTVTSLAWTSGTVTEAEFQAHDDTTVQARWRDRDGQLRKRRVTLRSTEPVLLPLS